MCGNSAVKLCLHLPAKSTWISNWGCAIFKPPLSRAPLNENQKQSVPKLPYVQNLWNIICVDQFSCTRKAPIKIHGNYSSTRRKTATTVLTGWPKKQPKFRSELFYAKCGSMNFSWVLCSGTTVWLFIVTYILRGGVKFGEMYAWQDTYCSFRTEESIEAHGEMIILPQLKIHLSF